MGDGSERITAIEIYGQTYHVKGIASREHVARLAHYLDGKMREVSDHTPTVDTLKVAILAALNIADQYLSSRQRLQELEQILVEKSEKLSSNIDAAIGRKST